MLTYTGKFGAAKVMLKDHSDIDEATVSQIYTMINHPKFNKDIVIMPDCHSGKGSVIGFTMPVDDAVIPNVVGVDISCGMLVVELPVDACPDLEKLDIFIRENIPAGHNIHGRPVRFLKDYMGKYYESNCYGFLDLSEKVGQRVKPLESLGTLGGGNHFIEVDYSDRDNKYYLVIHSGSRNLGARVCDYYQDIAVKYCSSDSGAPLISKELAYIDKKYPEYGKYLDDMVLCMMYASYNREIMAATILRDFFGVKGWNLNWHTEYHDDKFHCTHNYIGDSDDTGRLIIRKGAICAQEGTRLIIPLNMKDGCILGVGKGNKEWNYSAPHGAGRLLSRSQANKSLDMDTFRQTMDGIYSTSICEGTLDESPMAYKNPEMIKEMISDTVDIRDIIRPVYNFKAQEDGRKRKKQTVGVLQQ